LPAGCAEACLPSCGGGRRCGAWREDYWVLRDPVGVRGGMFCELWRGAWSPFVRIERWWGGLAVLDRSVGIGWRAADDGVVLVDGDSCSAC